MLPRCRAIHWSPLRWSSSVFGRVKCERNEVMDARMQGTEPGLWTIQAQSVLCVAHAHLYPLWLWVLTDTSFMKLFLSRQTGCPNPILQEFADGPASHC